MHPDYQGFVSIQLIYYWYQQSAWCQHINYRLLQRNQSMSKFLKILGIFNEIKASFDIISGIFYYHSVRHYSDCLHCFLFTLFALRQSCTKLLLM